MCEDKEIRQILVETFNLDGSPSKKELPKDLDIGPKSPMIVVDTDDENGRVKGEWLRPELGLKFRAWFDSDDIQVCKDPIEN